MMSPSRCEQVIPAACRNVASPSICAQSASQVARSREVSRRGSPVPPASAVISGVVRFRRPGSAPRLISAAPAKRGGLHQRPWYRASTGTTRARGPGPLRRRRRTGRRRQRRGVAQVAAVSPAPAPRQTSAAARIRRPRWAGHRRVPGSRRSPRAVRRLGVIAGQRHIRGIQRGPQPGAGNRRFVRSVRRARRTGPARRWRTARSPTGAAAPREPGPRPSPRIRSQPACPLPTAGSSPVPAPPAWPGSPRPGRTPPPPGIPTTAARTRCSQQPALRPGARAAEARPAARRHSHWVYTVRDDRGYRPMPP